MKYGEHFEKESVPEWSLHNIDYNALKHHIKVYTTKGQASAIAIPGHQDSALGRFEDEMFLELSRQHDRVDLFVASKADELSRRLEHIASQIQRLTLRCASSTKTLSLKGRRRFAKYEDELETCKDEIQALQRFANAQRIAFRKILKKYRKWTGSASLGNRFRDTVLTHPKSFTCRDFSHLLSRCDELLMRLRAFTPLNVEAEGVPSTTLQASEQPTVTASAQGPPPQVQNLKLGHQGYWNEYDDGSEAGDVGYEGHGGGEYALYIDQREGEGFPGMATLVGFFRIPVKRAKAWLAARRSDSSSPQVSERDGLLRAGNLAVAPSNPYGSMGQSSSDPGSLTETDGANDSSSSLGTSPATRYDASFASRNGYDIDRLRQKLSSSLSSSTSSFIFPSGYESHHAQAHAEGFHLPSLAEQRARHSRDRTLAWGTLAAFLASILLLFVAGLLAITGRHRLRAEVDAGVIVGAAGSLASACGALGISLTRKEGLSRWTETIATWLAFAAICVVNGALLVVVVGQTV